MKNKCAPAGEPLRMCVVCREMKPKVELIKVRKSAGGKFLFGEGDGRGAYVCRTEECVKKCRIKKGINRAFKCEVPTEVYGQLEEIFERSR